MTLWAPMIILVFGSSKLLAGKNGKVPKWMGTVMVLMFKMVWGTYDGVFKRVFGEGERTIEDKEDQANTGGCASKRGWFEQKGGVSVEHEEGILTV